MNQHKQVLELSFWIILLHKPATKPWTHGTVFLAAELRVGETDGISSFSVHFQA